MADNRRGRLSNEGLAKPDQGHEGLAHEWLADGTAWLMECREAIEAWNEYFAQYGLPLASFRQF